MFVKFEVDDHTTLYFFKTVSGDLRIEEHKSGADAHECVYGRSFTPAQATELRQFLTSQGF